MRLTRDSHGSSSRCLWVLMLLYWKISDQFTLPTMSVIALWCTLACFFMLTPGVLHHCLAQPNSATSMPTAQKTESYALNRTVDLLQRLADARVFSGTVAIQKGGSIVFSGGYGYAVEVA